jgi:uncharacterized membrane protein
MTSANSAKKEPPVFESRNRAVSIVVRIVLLAVMTALVFVVTKTLYVPISIVPGQVFDAGDIMIFISAWTFGPGTGGFAGGVGSALSDALTGGVFAPFTLVIKGTEGFLAGYFRQKRSLSGLRTSWLLASLVMVGGYFLTNALLIGLIYGTNSQFNPGLVLALVEIPFDIAQVTAGGIVGRRVSEYLKASLPSIFLPGGSVHATPTGM